MLMYISKALPEKSCIGSMASSSRGETEPKEHGPWPSTLTSIDHEDEDDLLKDLPETAWNLQKCKN